MRRANYGRRARRDQRSLRRIRRPLASSIPPATTSGITARPVSGSDEPDGAAGALGADPPAGPVEWLGDAAAAALTTTTPCMKGWMLHWYWNVPACVKVCEELAPGRIGPLSKLP